MLRSTIFIAAFSLFSLSFGTAKASLEPPSQRVQDIAQCIDYLSTTESYDTYFEHLIEEANYSPYIAVYMFQKPFERMGKEALGEFDHAEFARAGKRVCREFGVGLDKE